MVALYSPAEIVDCGHLDSPSDGVVNVTDTCKNSIATYGCSLGYYLAGPSVRTCLLNGSWSGPNPVCNSELAAPVHHANSYGAVPIVCQSIPGIYIAYTMYYTCVNDEMIMLL